MDTSSLSTSQNKVRKQRRASSRVRPWQGILCNKDQWNKLHFVKGNSHLLATWLNNALYMFGERFTLMNLPIGTLGISLFVCVARYTPCVTLGSCCRSLVWGGTYGSCSLWGLFLVCCQLALWGLLFSRVAFSPCNGCPLWAFLLWISFWNEKVVPYTQWDKMVQNKAAIS